MKWYDHVVMILLILGLAYIFNAIIPESPNQPTMTCYSPHDVYKVYDYEIVDDNKTLITSHGRIYHMSECTKD